MKFELLHPADQLVEMMNRIYSYGMTTTSGGNLSICDANGDIWITPSGIDKGGLTRADIMQVKPDGTVIGPHKPSVELPIHSNIYRLRPDLKAIVHAHPPVLVSFSLVRRLPDVKLLANVARRCGKVSMAAYDTPGSLRLGKFVSDEFAKGFDIVMMENHGVCCGGSDMARAFQAFETITASAQMELSALKLGQPRQLAEIPEETLPEMEACAAEYNIAARRELCAMVRRCYDQRLFTSTQGSYSLRLQDGSLLVTPHDWDRKYIDPEDFVRVQGKACEAGKTPSADLPLHQAIYAAHPEIQAVITAQSPAAMAFAVTDAVLDSHLMSESYIILRNVGRAPHGTPAEAIAAAIHPMQPVILVENQCIVATGKNLLNAFDRLEVLEYSAQAIIDAHSIGSVVSLSQAEMDDVDKTYPV